MKWPRGKWNGRKIQGFKISFELHVLKWYWVPIFAHNWGEPLFRWLCFSVIGKKSFL